jgi:TPP-dependent pyruvate/acetoin dehydrogenase alpha subunit
MTIFVKNELGGLDDPTAYNSPLQIDIKDSKSLESSLKRMLLIRKVENHIALSRKNGLIRGPVHLGAGQEAIAVGVSKHIRSSDKVFGAHRSHAHLLALNPDYYKLFAEVLGKKTGFSKGMGGSMHLWDAPSGFYGSVPIVSGTVPLAVGAAMAAKLQNTKDIAVVYIGDGAMEEGVVHESLNLARIQNAPVIFVVENNLFASHMHISLRQPSSLTSRFAIANHIPYKLVDGNNVIEVSNSAKKLIENSRKGSGPGFLELVTYRWYGHVDWRDDVDVGVKRSLDDIDNWKARDPILRLSSAMIDSKMWSKEQEQSLEDDLDNQINNAWEKAMNDPYPNKSSILNSVYSSNFDRKK